MSEQNPKLWLVKHKDGRIDGPFSSEDVDAHIRDKKISEDTKISSYPNGEWKPVTSLARFYDLLLDVISQPTQIKEEQSHVGQDSSRLEQQEDSAESDIPSDFKMDTDTEDKEEDLGNATQVANIDVLRKLKKERKKKVLRASPSYKKKVKKSLKETQFYASFEDQESLQEHTQQKQDLAPAPTDQKNLKKKTSRSKNRKRPLSLFLIPPIALGAALMFFLQSPGPKRTTEYVQLKLPQKKTSLPKEEIETLTKKGVIEYLRSTTTSHLKAQNLLVKALEANSKNTYALSILCLVYLELWPFTKQDFKDQTAVNKVNKRLALLNRGGVQSGLCSVVSLLINGKYQESKTMVESSLDGLSGAGQDAESARLTPMLYYLKALSLYYLNDYSTVAGYLDTVSQILPLWVAPQILYANILLKQGKVSPALSIFHQISKKYPQHKEANLQIALIEYRHFKKTEESRAKLISTLSNKDKVPYQLLSDAYFALADIYLKSGNQSDALKNARLAYSYNPTHNQSRQMILQLGGKKQLRQTNVRSTQLVAKADQLARENKIQEAVAHYEQAFKLDKEKNATVAIKVAKNLWTLSFFKDAIDWLKKASMADPENMEPYALMADYYTQKYDFHNADKMLNLGSKKSPRSHEIFRGKAILEMRRENYGKAIAYSQTALSIYEADVASHVILSESYAKTGQMNEALVAATKALETDPNSPKAQITYAKALGYLYGIDTGVNYFHKLIDNYPLVMEYKMELAKYLFEDEQYPMARKWLVSIIEMEPKYNDAYFYLGRILMFDGHTAEAYEAFLQAAISNPTDPKPTYYIGLLRIKEKRYALAKEQFNKVITLNKRYPKAYFHLGRIAYMEKQYDEAIRFAGLESQYNPQLTEPYILAGESYEKMNKFLDCAGEYQKAIEMWKENLNLYVKTARCYRKSGYLDLAVKILKKASGPENKEVKSGDPQLYKELGEVYEVRGAYLEALGSYCNYLNLMPRALDRKVIETRMKKLSQLTGQAAKKCG